MYINSVIACSCQAMTYGVWHEGRGMLQPRQKYCHLCGEELLQRDGRMAKIKIIDEIGHEILMPMWEFVRRLRKEQSL